MSGRRPPHDVNTVFFFSLEKSSLWSSLHVREKKLRFTSAEKTGIKRASRSRPPKKTDSHHFERLVVVDVLLLSSSHVRRLSTLVVDVGPELRGWKRRRGGGESILWRSPDEEEVVRDAPQPQYQAQGSPWPQQQPGQPLSWQPGRWP